MNIPKINNYYQDKVDPKNPDYKIHGWESEEAQYKRFNVLYKEVKMGGKTLLDVGCGVGTLLRYFSDRRIKTTYVGVDVVTQMIQIAKERYPTRIFLAQDIFSDNPFPEDSFQVVFASGIFNLDLGNNEQFMQNAIALFGELASEHVVFNCLSTKSTTKKKEYFYTNPESIPYIIKKSGIRCKKYRIVEGYLQNDFTVIIEKDVKDERYEYT